MDFNKLAKIVGCRTNSQKIITKMTIRCRTNDLKDLSS